MVLSGAVATNQLPVTASFMDTASTAYQTIRASGGSQLANTNNTTAVDIVSAPRAGYIRTINNISVRNNDTATATVTIRYNDNGTLYNIIQSALTTLDQLYYTDSAGWFVLDSSGNLKTGPTIASAVTNQLAFYNSSTTIAGETLLQASNFPQLTGDVTTVAGAVATTLATVTVAKGGTGLTTGTSGGVLGFTGTGTLASSVLLTANALVLGAGAGATPTVVGSLGTTTTLLHGNASGAPTFAAVSLTADVSGTLPVANGGLGITSGTSGGVPGFTASGTIASSAALTANGIVIGGGAGATPSSTAALTNGQLAIGSTGLAPVPATLTGTANQLTVTNAAGSITLSTPQNTHTAATPQFAGLGLGVASNATGLAIAPAALSQTPGVTGSYFNLAAATVTDNGTAASGTLAQFAASSHQRPTLAASNLTVTTTDAATLYIANSPLAGTNETITNAWAIQVAAGNVKFAGTGNSVGTITAGTWNGTAINLASYATGILPAASHPALTGDVTTVAGAVATTIGASKVAQGNLKTTTAAGSITVGAAVSDSFTLTGGTYSWWTASGTVGTQPIAFGNGDTAAGLIGLYNTDSVSSRIFYVDERYVQASPPYNLGNGDIPLFVFLALDGSGKIIHASVAPDPTWAYHGPTKITPEFYVAGKPYRNYKTVEGIALSEAIKIPALKRRILMNQATIEDTPMEITQEIKKKDMPLFPHPFVGNNLTGLTIIMVDPISAVVQRLADIQNEISAKEVLHMFSEGYLLVGNIPINIFSPPGVMPVAVKFSI